MAAMSATTPTTMVTMAAFVAHPPFLVRIIAVQHCQDRSDEEEDTVHDAQGKACLEQSARLVDIDSKAVEMGGTEDAKGGVVGAAGGDVGAVGASNEAQVVDACYQGANEGKVDEGDEAGVVAAAVVAEQGEDGPCRAEDGDDEEDQDVCRSQEVVPVVAIDEVAEYAEEGNLFAQEALRLAQLAIQRCAACVAFRAWTEKRGLTRVRISMKRQKAKNTANSMA